MKKLRLHDVGDGLNLQIKNRNKYDLTVDFGGNKNLKKFAYFEDNFLLSHFHLDHYKGFLVNTPQSERSAFWRLINFYHPVMPKVENKETFLKCFFAMTLRLNSDLFPIQNSILSLIQEHNIGKEQINFKPVGKGDILFCGGKKYQILWPPKEVKHDEVRKEIITAISDFNKAKDTDKLLEKVYQKIDTEYHKEDLNNLLSASYGDFFPNKKSKEINKDVMKANKSLQKAANRLSIAFKQDDNILFLGDLEKKEIQFVVNDLIETGDKHFDVIIAAHHGTHWHDSLKSISCDYCLASVGKNLQNKIEYDYKDIASKLVRTDEWGDIKIKKTIKVKT